MTFALPDGLPPLRHPRTGKPDLRSEDIDIWLDACLDNAGAILDAANTLQAVLNHGGFSQRETAGVINRFRDTLEDANRIFNHSNALALAIKAAQAGEAKEEPNAD